MLPLYAAIALTLAAAVWGLLGMWRTRQRADDLVTAMLAISIVIACMGGLVLLGLVVAETNGPEGFTVRERARPTVRGTSLRILVSRGDTLSRRVSAIDVCGSSSVRLDGAQSKSRQPTFGGSETSGRRAGTTPTVPRTSPTLCGLSGPAVSASPAPARRT